MYGEKEIGDDMRLFNKALLWLLVLALPTQSFAAADRTLDGKFITSGSATLTLPTSTDTLLGRATTDTLTNKSLSGSTNIFTNISLTTAVTGTLPVGNGGTGAVSFTLNGILFGNSTSAVQVTAAGSQYQSLQAGSGGVPQFGAIQLNQAAAVSGALGIANGGSGQTTANAALNAFLPSQSGNSGKYLTTNGTDSSWAASGAPTLVGSRASPTLITAAGGVAFTSTLYKTINFIAGDSGAIDITANPQIAAGSTVGQELLLIGRHATNTVTFEDGTGLSLNGMWVAGLDSVLGLVWDGTNWVESFRR